MYHVQQSRPALHHAHSHSYSYSQYDTMHSSSSLAAIKLPGTLSRPARVEPSRDNIAALEPNLAAASIEYVRKQLRDRGEEFNRMASAVHLPPTLQRGQLHQSQYMAARATHQSATSLHVLAVFSAKVPPHDTALSPTDTAYIFPVHMLNLAVDCAFLPRLARAPARLRSDGAVDLPVVQINVPHAEAFAPLHAFLLTHRVDRFFSMLVPIPSSYLTPSRGSSSHGAGPLAHLNAQQLATVLVQTASGDKRVAIMTLVNGVKAVWRNTCALGIFDRDLWAAIDLAWETVLIALNMIAGGH